MTILGSRRGVAGRGSDERQQGVGYRYGAFGSRSHHFAADGCLRFQLFDVNTASAGVGFAFEDLLHPDAGVNVTSNDPAELRRRGQCHPLGMKPDDPLPFDIVRLARRRSSMRGRDETGDNFRCSGGHPGVAANYQVELPTCCFPEVDSTQYLEFFGFGTTTPEAARGGENSLNSDADWLRTGRSSSII